ncbi:hypothetical protein FOB58_004315 [Candida parapsilosis]|uniref:Uncharacterized protein n=1 Tax=Candida parapsilosis TaxID=5480 RepID=A0A8X7TBM7_CANPA|nr:hypothetical protein FOB58_004315 [Candida parapsilosis]KAF6046569.1 hypothetical protein FOB59_004034 [Candida parapsilosis]KAF6050990.1 hypothetical protein FOB60_003658 [Candida parapsilosis]KAF6062288.1 hypothetical protein FOB61_003718 [Candida parapsilosis]KAI5904444.1 hypothetical protein K4G60_g3602 [Candida parapsilosis]
MLSDVDDVGTVVVELLLNKVIGVDLPCVEADNVANAPPKFMYSKSPIFKFSSDTSLFTNVPEIDCGVIVAIGFVGYSCIIDVNAIGYFEQSLVNYCLTEDNLSAHRCEAFHP